MFQRTSLLTLLAAILSSCSHAHDNVVVYTGAGDTSALQAAIDSAGAGTVHIPARIYHTGPLRLHDHLTLILDPGVVLIASNNPADFPVTTTRFEGSRQSAYAALLSAENASDISIQGGGTIDGSGQLWWDRALDTAHPMPYPRPRLIEFLHCHDVSVRGITLKNPPCWTIHPAYCDNVTIDGVTITAPPTSPNTDGIDPDSSSNVTISHCTFDCGDDCIAIKSGKDAEGRAENIPCRDIAINDCTMLHGIAGVGIGSEMSGGVFNVNVSHCSFTGTGIGVRVKTRRGRGGVVHDLTFSDLTMTNVDEAFELTAYFWETTDNLPPAERTEETPTFRDIKFAKLSATNVKWAGKIDGLPEQPIENITLDNVKISADSGMYLRYATGLKFTNVSIDAKSGLPFLIDHAEYIPN